MVLSDTKGRSRGKETRFRTKYSDEQLEMLEETFTKSQYPDSDVLADLADSLDIALDKIIVWFQNRRSKFKRQSKGTKMSWMRKQFYVASDSTKEQPNTCKPMTHITPSPFLPAGHVISPQQTIGSQISRKLYFSPEREYVPNCPDLEPLDLSYRDSPLSSPSSTPGPSSRSSSPDYQPLYQPLQIPITAQNKISNAFQMPLHSSFFLPFTPMVATQCQFFGTVMLPSLECESPRTFISL